MMDEPHLKLLYKANTCISVCTHQLKSILMCLIGNVAQLPLRIFSYTVFSCMAATVQNKIYCRIFSFPFPGFHILLVSLPQTLVES